MSKQTKKYNYRQQAVVTLDAETRSRQTRRHLDELEKDNYITTADLDSTNVSALIGKKDISTSSASGGPSKKRRKTNQNVRKLIFTKKNLSNLLEESKINQFPSNISSYLTAQIGPSKYPPRFFCSICGYWGNYTCLRCGMRYCSLQCRGTHLETRCMKFVG